MKFGEILPSGLGRDVLAHLIRISEILPWDRNLIYPMLSYPGCHMRATHIGCIGTHAHCRQVTSLLC